MMARGLRCCAALLAAWLCGATLAEAHQSSNSYLRLRADAGTVPELQWDIALRDLDVVLGLDADGDGQLRWGEIRARQQDIISYAFERLQLRRNQAACSAVAPRLLLDEHTDGAYAVLQAEIHCADGRWPQHIDYHLFDGVDAGHRGLLRAMQGTATIVAVLGGDATAFDIDFAPHAGWRRLRSFAATGVQHVWSGLDHLLFLLSLLLPAVLLRVGRQWLPQHGLRPAFLEVCAIVTAFTVAHSITLSLATLGVLRLPARLTESAIALSVVVAALNNLLPWLRARLWLVAFGFGLVHGFGFASVLSDLDLSGGATALALIGFNCGVEAGQLAIVALFLPLAFLLRHTLLYRRVLLLGGSLTIALLGALWMVERISSRQFLPVH
jgi:HupE / UreJ protein